jgi:hypothetical protein
MSLMNLTVFRAIASGEQTVVQMQVQGGQLRGEHGLPADVDDRFEERVLSHRVQCGAAQPNLQYRTLVRI